jgi:hypothetical protein
MIGQVKAPGAFMPEVGPWRGFLPDIAAAHRPIVHFSGGLTDWPDHPEITDRCTYGPVRAFEDLYRKSLYGKCSCRSQSNNAGANNDS